ncbi:MAG: hypothetical protein GX595_01815 [Lentisphaerae bacterium]|nr:hypothetical protein [Lentisphaerota bacterium]
MSPIPRHSSRPAADPPGPASDRPGPAASSPSPGLADEAAPTTPPATAGRDTRNPTEHRPNAWRAVLPDLAAFALGLGLAYVLTWETADLVWSLWLGSLIIGYLTILTTLGSAGLTWLRVCRHPDLTAGHRAPLALGGLLAGLFTLAFFSVHFCGFHAGHSVFLNQFFPLEGVPKDGFGRAFVNPPLLWLMAWKHLLRPYGLFLIPAILSERDAILGPIRRAWRTPLDATPPDSARADEPPAEAPRRRPKPQGLNEAMVRPYANVVRMHLLIFFFAFCHAANLDSFIVYAVVYAVYFFPWRTVKALRPGNRRRRAAQAP